MEKPINHSLFSASVAARSTFQTSENFFSLNVFDGYIFTYLKVWLEISQHVQFKQEESNMSRLLTYFIWLGSAVHSSGYSWRWTFSEHIEKHSYKHSTEMKILQWVSMNNELTFIAPANELYYIYECYSNSSFYDIFLRIHIPNFYHTKHSPHCIHLIAVKITHTQS